MCEENGAALVADFQRYYRLDLVSVVGGSISPRRAVALIEHLPENSAFTTAIRGGREFAGWNTSAYLLAALIDSVNLTTWAVSAQNAKKRPTRPKPFERPGQRKRNVRAAESMITNNPHAMPIPEHRLPKS
ncbi:hypothetical protein [Streptomyces katsurahamanus]|uniref:Transposase n=1 Tax=Streptomyces katsurahamanus TaxID=2577098 RepID=A0ABW9P3H5_9ACTN|nr:hypothetical protein [Streptomyces katsurahamanus]MQS39926.1 hypothetical protein [Streptomyces katsurahamanus]